MHLVAAWDWRRSGSSGCSSSLPSSLWSPTTIPVSWSSKLRETGLLIDDIYSIMCYNILIWWYIVNICKNELYTLYDNIILYIYMTLWQLFDEYLCIALSQDTHMIFFFNEPMNQFVVGKVRACLRNVTFHWGLTRLWSPWSQRFPSDLVRCLPCFQTFWPAIIEVRCFDLTS